MCRASENAVARGSTGKGNQNVDLRMLLIEPGNSANELQSLGFDGWVEPSPEHPESPRQLETIPVSCGFNLAWCVQTIKCLNL